MPEFRREGMAESGRCRVTLWRTLLNTLAKNPISFFAVLCVACTALFLGYMVVWQTSILSSPSWCAKAMGAEKIAPGQTVAQTLEALKSCNNLLMVQLEALAADSHIDHSAFALVLVFLIVVVVAGARASWKLSKAGFEGTVERDDPGDPPTPVIVTNAPTQPVPTAEAPKPTLPPVKPPPTSDERG